MAPVSLYAIGLGRKDTKMQRTALLAGEALADSEILTTVLKASTKRLRPADNRTANVKPGVGEVAVHGDVLAALAVSPRATPSRRSPQPPSSPAVTAIIAGCPTRPLGQPRSSVFPRLTPSAHNLSDVFMGAALGYTVSRFPFCANSR